VGVAPSLTTKLLVVACELPAVLFLLWVSIRGHTVQCTRYNEANPTLFLACVDGLVCLGLASKILVARFWRSYHAHLKLGAALDFAFELPLRVLVFEHLSVSAFLRFICTGNHENLTACCMRIVWGQEADEDGEVVAVKC